MQPILADKAFPELVQWADELAALRRDIHAHPELGFETPRTVDLIVKTLKGWGLEHVDPDEVKGGVVVVINGAAPGATVALRADIDALPMPDNSANPWKSQTEMRCHACGHDGHAAWLLGALRYLHEKRASFKGRVVGIFQPAEEIGRGALRVVQSGVFEHWGIQEIYGAHDEPTVAKGQYGLCAGPAQASTDFFYITVKGRGVHAARPHLGVDPITTAGVLIGALQTIVSRKVNPIETAVLSISSVNGGNFHTPNVIPETVTLSGTVRTFNEDVRNQIEAEMARMVERVAEAANSATIVWCRRFSIRPKPSSTFAASSRISSARSMPKRCPSQWAERISLNIRLRCPAASSAPVFAMTAIKPRCTTRPSTLTTK